MPEQAHCHPLESSSRKIILLLKGQITHVCAEEQQHDLQDSLTVGRRAHQRGNCSIIVSTALAHHNITAVAVSFSQPHEGCDWQAALWAHSGKH